MYARGGARDSRWRVGDGASSISRSTRWLSRISSPFRPSSSRSSLDMMKEEGLVPVKPFEAEELVDLWSRSDAILQRDTTTTFELAKTKLEPRSDRRRRVIARRPHSHTSIGVRRPEGELITIGFESSDKGLVKRPRRSPTLWFALYGETWPTWDALVTQLEADPPQGWTAGDEWYGQPRFWRYLGEVVGWTGTFDDQRGQLADVLRSVRQWVDSHRPSDAGRSRRRWGRR